MGGSLEDDIEQVLVPADDIQERVRALAARVDADYAGQDVLLVGVLKGAFILMADLARYLTIPVEFDFMAVSSYGSATQTSAWSASSRTWSSTSPGATCWSSRTSSTPA